VLDRWSLLTWLISSWSDARGSRGGHAPSYDHSVHARHDRGRRGRDRGEPRGAV